MSLIYKEPRKMKMETILHELNIQNNIDNMCESLLSIGLYSEDPEKDKYILFYFIGFNNINIARMAILAIGHMARIHGNISKESFLLAIKHINQQYDLEGIIDDVLDDIDIYS